MNTPVRRTVPNFRGYAIDTEGALWSCWTRRYLTGKGRRGVVYDEGETWVRMRTTTGKGGYVSVVLRRDGKPHHRLIHRLVLEAFHGPCPDGMECSHENNNRSDNRLENLSWKTKQSNQLDRRKFNTHPAGENNGHAVLTNRQAAEVRNLATTGISKTEIARRFGVSRTVVSRITLGKTYTSGVVKT